MIEGGEQKKESVCSWVEQHGLLDEPRTCVIGYCTIQYDTLRHNSYAAPSALSALIGSKDDAVPYFE